MVCYSHQVANSSSAVILQAVRTQTRSRKELKIFRSTAGIESRLSTYNAQGLRTLRTFLATDGKSELCIISSLLKGLGKEMISKNSSLKYLLSLKLDVKL